MQSGFRLRECGSRAGFLNWRECKSQVHRSIPRRQRGWYETRVRLLQVQWCFPVTYLCWSIENLQSYCIHTQKPPWTMWILLGSATYVTLPVMAMIPCVVYPSLKEVLRKGRVGDNRLARFQNKRRRRDKRCKPYLWEVHRYLRGKSMEVTLTG